MSVSADYLLRCSVETGFPAATLERVVRLGELAGDVARHPVLGEALALKGGTPLNLGFWPAPAAVGRPRLRLCRPRRARTDARRPSANRSRGRSVPAERQGYRVQRSADAFAGRKLHLHFRSADLQRPLRRPHRDQGRAQPLGDAAGARGATSGPPAFPYSARNSSSGVPPEPTTRTRAEGLRVTKASRPRRSPARSRPLLTSIAVRPWASSTT